MEKPTKQRTKRLKSNRELKQKSKQKTSPENDDMSKKIAFVMLLSPAMTPKTYCVGSYQENITNASVPIILIGLQKLP